MTAEQQEEYQVVVTGAADGFVQDVVSGTHHLKSDEPPELGGTGQGPDPYALLLAALGSCTSMTIGMYARRKKIPLERVTVYLRHRKVHAEDCVDCEQKVGKLDHIERRIELQGALDPEQRAALIKIADKCPVHRTLNAEIVIATEEVPSAPA